VWFCLHTITNRRVIGIFCVTTGFLYSYKLFTSLSHTWGTFYTLRLALQNDTNFVDSRTFKLQSAAKPAYPSSVNFCLLSQSRFVCAWHLCDACVYSSPQRSSTQEEPSCPYLHHGSILHARDQQFTSAILAEGWVRGEGVADSLGVLRQRPLLYSQVALNAWHSHINSILHSDWLFCLHVLQPPKFIVLRPIARRQIISK